MHSPWRHIAGGSDAGGCFMLKLSGTSDTKITEGELRLLIKLNGLLRGWTFSGIFSKPRLIVGFDPVTFKLLETT